MWCSAREEWGAQPCFLAPWGSRAPFLFQKESKKRTGPERRKDQALRSDCFLRIFSLSSECLFGPILCFYFLFLEP